jgi:radical SAM protein with 4Fe4S-binding SPASM domain
MFETVSQIILKVTNDCNLRCQYCYLANKDAFKGSRLSFQNYKKLIQRILFDKKRSNVNKQKNIQIVFHGGEPTLVDVKTIKKFILYAKKYLPNVSFGLQSNLTRFDQNWIELCLEENIAVGTSLDGVGPGEGFLRGKENETTAANFLRAQAQGCNIGVIMVISQENIKKYAKNIRLFRRTFGQKMVKANYVENIKQPGFCFPEVSGDELYEHVFKPTIEQSFKNNELLEGNIYFLLNRFFYALLHRPIHDQDNCNVKFCKGGSDIVEVDFEGNVCFCGRWSSVNKDNVLGNAFRLRSDIFGLPSLSDVIQLQKKKIAELRRLGCEECPAKHICDFGCIAFSHAKFGGQIRIREEIVCRYYKQVYAYLSKNVGIVLYILFRKKQFAMSQTKKAVAFDIDMPISIQTRESISRVRALFSGVTLILKDNRLQQIVLSRKCLQLPRLKKAIHPQARATRRGRAAHG